MATPATVIEVFDGSVLVEFVGMPVVQTVPLDEIEKGELMDKSERYHQVHDRSGNPLYLGTTQDAAGEHCPTCGRTTEHSYNHAFDCPAYRPHPASIAALTVTPDGQPLVITETQDVEGFPCRCGRVASEPWQHALTCAHFAPHPQSLAARH